MSSAADVDDVESERLKKLRAIEPAVVTGVGAGCGVDVDVGGCGTATDAGEEFINASGDGVGAGWVGVGDADDAGSDDGKTKVPFLSATNLYHPFFINAFNEYNLS